MLQQTISIIASSRNTILKNWLSLYESEMGFHSNLINIDVLRDQAANILSALELAFANEFESLDDQISVLTLQWAKLGFTARDTINFIFNLKHALLRSLQENIGDAPLLHLASQEVDKLLDSVGMSALETSIRVRESEIIRQYDEINDMSTPVIELWEGILVMAIVGTLDSSRTHSMMEELLVKVSKKDIQISILDISGVPAIDSTVAQHLIKLVTAVRLLGAECIISGIRPEIAQTIVNLGINLQGITTKSTLADALKIGFNKKELTVSKFANYIQR